MPGPDQTLREPSSDGFCDGLQVRFQLQQLDAPHGQVPQCFSGQSLLWVLCIAVDQENFLRGGWREQQRIASGLEILAEIVCEIEVGCQIQRHVSVESQPRPWSALAH